MLVKCNFVSGSAVPREQRFPGESERTRYTTLVVSEEYCVYGLLFSRRRVNYLVSPVDAFHPEWLPSCLFTIIDPSIPPEFLAAEINEHGEFGWLHTEYGAMFIIGYQKLVESSEHFVGLLEREEDDLIAFYKMTVEYQERQQQEESL